MKRLMIPTLTCAALLAAPAIAPRCPAAKAVAQDFSPRPFHELAESVTDRYRGRLIGAQMAPPTPHERMLGAALVYEFRLLTPQRNLLLIRLDARSGRFLEIAGRGQTAARRMTDKEDD